MKKIIYILIVISLCLPAYGEDDNTKYHFNRSVLLLYTMDVQSKAIEFFANNYMDGELMDKEELRKFLEKSVDDEIKELIDKKILVLKEDE